MKKYGRTVMSGGQIGLTVLCVFLALVLIAMIFVTAYANYYLGLIQTIPGTEPTIPSDVLASMDNWTETMPPDFTGPTVDATIVTEPGQQLPDTIIKHKDLVNILLVGQDRRPGEGRQRSDTMMVVTFNKRDKVITLTSFMRDLYVYIPGYDKANKMNFAYLRGGFPMLCDTLMLNFGVDIDGCVEVDFDGFVSVIDALGGLDMVLKENEVKQINGFYGYDLKVGLNHLNGEEALAYARERYNMGDDYGRTERQRKVVAEVMRKCMDQSLPEMLELLEELLPIFATNMDKGQIVRYVMDLFPLLSGSQIQNLRIPASGAYEEVYINKIGSSLVPDLEKNRKLLVENLLPN